MSANAEQPGFTPAGLEQLHEVAARHVVDDAVPGFVALVARGDEVHVEAHGTLAVGGAPVARESLFRIASTTKPITAAATLFEGAAPPALHANVQAAAYRALA